MAEVTSNWESLKAIVADALELPASERDQLLHAACGGDTSLLAEARSLVAAYESADGVIDARTDAWLGLGGPDLLSLGGQKVGRYTLERLLAEGAMAAVYVARQNNPQRAVALKLVRFNMPMVDAAVRFKRESQALGRLQHPNIARIYEAGVHHPPGTAAMPFIAMELVDGPPLSIFARERNLNRSQRIRLMIKVASAVHAAHQQAIIHRDLKPANVLVDQSGEPKVLDFGIARIIGADDQENLTWQTTAGVLLGTPGYMSPEQASGNAASVDVRSDVWSLGVLLYELLADRLPIEVKNTSIAQVLKRIETVDPEPLGRLDTSLRGDLETIAMTALAREKDRRYPSAQALADDLQRVLDYQPIHARAPTRAYRLKKFVQRHRLGLAATAIIILTLLGTSIVSWRAYRKAEASRLLAEASRLQAETSRARAESINQFLLEIMSTTDPNIGDRDITVKQALGSSDHLIEKNFSKDPTTEAEVRSTIGWTFYQLGDYDKAVAQLRRAVELRTQAQGADNVETLDDMARLITTIRWQSKPEEALKLAQTAFETARAKLGDENATTLSILDNLAGAYDDLGREAEAEPIYRKVVELSTKVIGPSNSQTLTAMNNWSVVLINLGRTAEAEPVLRKVIEERQKGSRTSRVAAITNRHNLCTVLTSLGRIEESIREFESTIADARQMLGEEHSRTLAVKSSYSDALVQAGRYDQALAINREVLEIRQRQLGQFNDLTLTSVHNTITALLSCKQFVEAESLSRHLIADVDGHTPPNHMLRIVARQDLANALSGLHRYAEAEPAMLDVIARIQERFGEKDHPRALVQQNNLASMLFEMQRYEDTIKILDTIGQALQKRPVPIIEASYQRNVGRTLLRLKQYQKAEQPLIRSWQVYQTSGNTVLAADVASMLVELYRATGNNSAAEKYELESVNSLATHSATTMPTTQPN